MPDIQWDSQPDQTKVDSVGAQEQQQTPEGIQWDSQPDQSKLSGVDQQKAAQPTKVEKAEKFAMTPLMDADQNEKREKEFSTSAPTLAESEHPIWTGVKKGLAGADASTREMLRNMFTSPLGIASLGIGAAGEIPGSVGTIAKATGAVTGAGLSAAGAKGVVQGVKDIKEKGITPDTSEEVLNNAALAAGGAAGAGRETVETAKALPEPAKAAIERATTPRVIGSAAGAALGRAVAPSLEGSAIGAAAGRYGADILLGPEKASKPLLNLRPKPMGQAEPYLPTSAFAGVDAERSPEAAGVRTPVQQAAPLGRVPVAQAEAAPLNGKAEGLGKVGLKPTDVEAGAGPKVKAPVFRDATRQNVPFAGEEITEEKEKPITTKEVDKSREVVGSAADAKRDTELFYQARKQLGPNASISDVASLAQKLKGGERRASTDRRIEQKPVVEERRTTNRRMPVPSEQYLPTDDKGKPLVPASERSDAFTPLTEEQKQKLANGKPRRGAGGAVAEPESISEHANAFNKERGLPDIKPEKAGKSEHAGVIADEFDKMKHDPNNLEVKKSYDALKKDIKDQWNYATQKMGIKIEPTDKDPYGFTGDKPAEKELFDDLKNNKHMSVWRGGNPLGEGHPLLEIDPDTKENYNTMLRAVHDIFGHAAQGHDFSEPGEESAWKAHMQMMSPEARPAMTTETRGQTSWFFNNKGKPNSFADQKAGLMPEWTSRPGGKPAMEADQVLDHIKNGKKYAILQAENPDNTRISEEENAKRTEALKKDLIERGYNPQEVIGNTKEVQGQTEHAFFIPEIENKDAIELGKKYGQASILSNNELHDLKTGEKTQFDNKNMLLGDEARNQTYFTKVGDKDFSLPMKEKATDEAAGAGPEGLSESERRALAYRVGKKAAGDVTPQGVERSMRLLKVTNQQLADFANEHGPAYPGDPTREWTAKDFSKAGTGKKALSPNKQLVFDHIIDNVPHTDFMEASKDWGTTPDLSKKLQGQGPAPKATSENARLSEDELKNKGYTQEDIDAGVHLPAAGGGTPVDMALARQLGDEKGIPEEISKYMTKEELEGVEKIRKGDEKFLEIMSKIPAVQEYIDIALKGEGARKWYQRSTAAFDAMTDAAPKYFDQPEDKEKFIGLLSGSSPRQTVAMNLRESLGAWKAWVDAGRPELSVDKWKEYVDSAKAAAKGKSSFWKFAPKGEEWAPYKLMAENFTSSIGKVPNVIKALNGEDLWPDLTKNSNFKVPSFQRNLSGWLKAVTNDGWMGMFAGLDPRELSDPTSYHPLSVATRAAAKELGWEPAEAQAAIWAFTQAFTNLTDSGKMPESITPEVIRMYSQDFADIMANDPVTRELLNDLGVKHAELDKHLAEIGEKPQVSGRTTPTTAHSVGELKERVKQARGRGEVPGDKLQENLTFREGPAHEERNRDTDFNPVELEKEDNEPLTNNASGESSASKEAINRSVSEKARGIKRYRVDTRSGQEIPLLGVDAVDTPAGPYDVIEERHPDGTVVTLDSGKHARRMGTKTMKKGA